MKYKITTYRDNGEVLLERTFIVENSDSLGDTSHEYEMLVDSEELLDTEAEVDDDEAHVTMEELMDDDAI